MIFAPSPGWVKPFVTSEIIFLDWNRPVIGMDRSTQA